MQYMGGKARIGSALARTILALAPQRKHYLEPFVGAGWMLHRMAPHFDTVWAGDADPNLGALYDALREGWEPPHTLSAEEYRALQAADRSPLRTFAGYGCSFGGKWFGGYARNSSGRDYCGAARRGLLSRRTALRFAYAPVDYRVWAPSAGCVVYCDPPYAGTTRYAGDPFDPAEFWATMQRWASAGAEVFVSEYAAPVGVAQVVWERSVNCTLAKDDNTASRVERLYRLTG